MTPKPRTVKRAEAERRRKHRRGCAVLRKNRGANQRRECRHYLCPMCDGWHLTSHKLRRTA